MNNKEKQKLVFGQWQCPLDWPTNCGSKELWEELGRTIGAFSLLENVCSRAIRSFTGHSTMRAALEDPDCVLNADFAGLMEETEVLRDSRNRLCHGAWIAFETPVSATVRFFPKREELDNIHQQKTSLDDLTCIKNRVMAVVGELGARVGETPVHEPTAQFWEEVGRTVATFGMLEDCLPRALYTITGLQTIDEAKDSNKQVEQWCAILIKSMSDTLGGLTSSLKSAWKKRDHVLQPEYATLLQEIQELTKLRNRVCHKTYQEFMVPDTAKLCDSPSDPGPAPRIREVAAIHEFQKARLRVVTAIAALRNEVRTKYGSEFPGANDS